MADAWLKLEKTGRRGALIKYARVKPCSGHGRGAIERERRKRYAQVDGRGRKRTEASGKEATHYFLGHYAPEREPEREKRTPFSYESHQIFVQITYLVQLSKEDTDAKRPKGRTIIDQ